MDSRKLLKSGASGVCVGVGVGLKLAKWGLEASEVVLNGAVNLANSFVKAPALGIGKAIFSDLKQQTGKLAKFFLQKGRDYRS